VKLYGNDQLLVIDAFLIYKAFGGFVLPYVLGETLLHEDDVEL
jgi:hypothetical protein